MYLKVVRKVLDKNKFEKRKKELFDLIDRGFHRIKIYLFLISKCNLAAISKSDSLKKLRNKYLLGSILKR